MAAGSGTLGRWQMQQRRHRRPSLPEPPFGGQPARRFRHGQQGTDANQHRHHPQGGDAAPADQPEQCCDCRRGKEAAHARREDEKAGDDRAMPRRRQLDHHRRRRRERRTEAEPDEKPQHGKQDPGAIGDHRDRRRSDRADEGAADDHRLAAPQVAKRAAGQRADDRPNAAAQQNGCCCAVGQMPLWPDHGDEEPDTEKVEEIDHPDRREQAEDCPISPVERTLIEHRQQIVRRGCSHLFLLPFVGGGRFEGRSAAPPTRYFFASRKS